MDNITLNIIAFNIFENLRANIGDDDSISIDQIKDEIHSVRAMQLKQKFDKAPLYIDSTFSQTLGPIEIEQVDSSIVTGVPAGKFMYRTKRDIPQTVERKHQEGTFLRIGPADRLNEKYHLVSYARALKSGNGRFNRDTIYVFIADERIYIISNGELHGEVQRIDIIGIFQNPRDVALFKDSNGDSLYSDDARYPISRSIVPDLEKIVLDRIKSQIAPPADEVNNSRDDIKNEGRRR